NTKVAWVVGSLYENCVVLTSVPCTVATGGPVSVTVTIVPLAAMVPAKASVDVVGVPVPTVVRIVSLPVNVPVADTTTLALASSTFVPPVFEIVNGSAVPFAVERFHVPAREMIVGVLSLSLPHAIRTNGSAARRSSRRI